MADTPSFKEMSDARATLAALLENPDLTPDARIAFMHSCLHLTFIIQSLISLSLGGATDTYGTHPFFDPSRN